MVDNYTPTWGKHVQDVYSEDQDKADLAAEAFQTERQKETANSQRARDWEKGRAEEWQKNKPEHVKKRIKEEARKDPSIKTLEKIKRIGSFKTGVIPSPGLILVEPDSTKKEIEGIILPESQDDKPNTGTVIASGNKIILGDNTFVEPPAIAGNRVIFRKGVGADITVEGKACKFLQFSDILGRIKLKNG